MLRLKYLLLYPYTYPIHRTGSSVSITHRFGSALRSWTTEDDVEDFNPDYPSILLFSYSCISFFRHTPKNFCYRRIRNRGDSPPLDTGKRTQTRPNTDDVGNLIPPSLLPSCFQTDQEDTTSETPFRSEVYS